MVAANPTVSGVQSLLDSMSGSAVPPVLVVDDAHLLTHPAVHDCLDLLIRAWQPRLRLILAARSDPVLPLHRYRLAGQMHELRACDLAMTPAEITEVLAIHGVTLPARDFDLFVARTEGWVGRRAAVRHANGGHRVSRPTSCPS